MSDRDIIEGLMRDLARAEERLADARARLGAPAVEPMVRLAPSRDLVRASTVESIEPVRPRGCRVRLASGRELLYDFDGSQVAALLGIPVVEPRPSVPAMSESDMERAPFVPFPPMPGLLPDGIGAEPTAEDIKGPPGFTGRLVDTAPGHNAVMDVSDLLEAARRQGGGK